MNAEAATEEKPAAVAQPPTLTLDLTREQAELLRPIFAAIRTAHSDGAVMAQIRKGNWSEGGPERVFADVIGLDPATARKVRKAATPKPARSEP